MSMRFEAAEIITSGECPLNCRYCYIPKTSAMQTIHADVVQFLESGAFLDNLEKILGPNLAFLGFWGAEPALTLDILGGQLGEIARRFPKAKNLNFSTSLIVLEPVIRFAQKMADYDMRLDIQISVDGQASITDKNRFVGAAAKVSENFIRLTQALQGTQSKIFLKWKPTLTIETVREMNKSFSELDSYFAFFKNLNRKFEEINKNPNLVLQGGTFDPTIAVPGKYTSDDGREFAIFVRELHRRGHNSVYRGRLERIKDFIDELGKKRMFTCSGANSQIGLDDKRLHICHRTFYFNDDRYVNSVLEEKDIENWDVSLFRRGAVDLVRGWYTPLVDDEMAKMKFDYVMRGFHDFWPLSLAPIGAITRELALINQAEERFVHDDNYLKMFTVFMATAFSCPMEDLLNTGSTHLNPLSMIRLLGNGVFEEAARTI